MAIEDSVSLIAIILFDNAVFFKVTFATQIARISHII